MRYFDRLKQLRDTRILINILLIITSIKEINCIPRLDHNNHGQIHVLHRCVPDPNSDPNAEFIEEICDVHVINVDQHKEEEFKSKENYDEIGEYENEPKIYSDEQLEDISEEMVQFSEEASAESFKENLNKEIGEDYENEPKIYPGKFHKSIAEIIGVKLEDLSEEMVQFSEETLTESFKGPKTEELYKEIEEDNEKEPTNNPGKFHKSITEIIGLNFDDEDEQFEDLSEEMEQSSEETSAESFKGNSKKKFYKEIEKEPTIYQGEFHKSIAKIIGVKLDDVDEQLEDFYEDMVQTSKEMLAESFKGISAEEPYLEYLRVPEKLPIEEKRAEEIFKPKFEERIQIPENFEGTPSQMSSERVFEKSIQIPEETPGQMAPELDKEKQTLQEIPEQIIPIENQTLQEIPQQIKPIEDVFIHPQDLKDPQFLSKALRILKFLRKRNEKKNKI